MINEESSESHLVANPELPLCHRLGSSGVLRREVPDSERGSLPRELPRQKQTSRTRLIDPASPTHLLRPLQHEKRAIPRIDPQKDFAVVAALLDIRYDVQRRHHHDGIALVGNRGSGNHPRGVRADVDRAANCRWATPQGPVLVPTKGGGWESRDMSTFDGTKSSSSGQIVCMSVRSTTPL